MPSQLRPSAQLNITELGNIPKLDTLSAKRNAPEGYLSFYSYIVDVFNSISIAFEAENENRTEQLAKTLLEEIYSFFDKTFSSISLSSSSGSDSIVSDDSITEYNENIKKDLSQLSNAVSKFIENKNLKNKIDVEDVSDKILDEIKNYKNSILDNICALIKKAIKLKNNVIAEEIKNFNSKNEVPLESPAKSSSSSSSSNKESLTYNIGKVFDNSLKNINKQIENLFRGISNTFNEQIINIGNTLSTLATEKCAYRIYDTIEALAKNNVLWNFAKNRKDKQSGSDNNPISNVKVDEMATVAVKSVQEKYDKKLLKIAQKIDQTIGFVRNAKFKLQLATYKILTLDLNSKKISQRISSFVKENFSFKNLWSNIETLLFSKIFSRENIKRSLKTVFVNLPVYFLKQLSHGIGLIFKKVGQFVSSFIKESVKKYSEFFKITLLEPAGALLKGILNVLKTPLVRNTILTILATPKGSYYTGYIFGFIAGKIVNKIKSVYNTVSQKVESIADSVSLIREDILSSVEELTESISETVSPAINFVSGIANFVYPIMSFIANLVGIDGVKFIGENFRTGVLASAYSSAALYKTTSILLDKNLVKNTPLFKGLKHLAGFGKRHVVGGAIGTLVATSIALGFFAKENKMDESDIEPESAEDLMTKNLNKSSDLYDKQIQERVTQLSTVQSGTEEYERLNTEIQSLRTSRDRNQEIINNLRDAMDNSNMTLRYLFDLSQNEFFIRQNQDLSDNSDFDAIYQGTSITKEDLKQIYRSEGVVGQLGALFRIESVRNKQIEVNLNSYGIQLRDSLKKENLVVFREPQIRIARNILDTRGGITSVDIKQSSYGRDNLGTFEENAAREISNIDYKNNPDNYNKFTSSIEGIDQHIGVYEQQKGISFTKEQQKYINSLGDEILNLGKKLNKMDENERTRELNNFVQNKLVNMSVKNGFVFWKKTTNLTTSEKNQILDFYRYLFNNLNNTPEFKNKFTSVIKVIEDCIRQIGSPPLISESDDGEDLRQLNMKPSDDAVLEKQLKEEQEDKTEKEEEPQTLDQGVNKQLTGIKLKTDEMGEIQDELMKVVKETTVLLSECQKYMLA